MHSDFTVSCRGPTKFVSLAMARASNSSKGKSTKKFAQRGHLDRAIKERRARQQKKSQIENRKALKSHSAGRGKPAPGKTSNGATIGDDDEDEDEEDAGLAAAAGLDGADSDNDDLYVATIFSKHCFDKTDMVKF